MPEVNMDVDNKQDCRPVELQPFIHQVGGHTSMFRFNENTVCKPLCSREYHFYSTLPPDLQPFTPECYGLVQVEMHVAGKDEVRFVAHTLDPHRQNQSNHKTDFVTEVKEEKEENNKSGKFVNCGDETKSNSTSHQNPWISRIFERQVKLLGHETSKKFILLENAVAKFRKPCVLDLKMGRRQYGDDASPQKRKLFQERCKTSTSGQLGVRASGMQVYKVDRGQYQYNNKYDGRALTVEGFKDSLGEFLHNGERLRIELINPILTKLRDLKQIVEKLDTFRFYSSSLLIIYDGKEDKGICEAVQRPVCNPPSVSAVKETDSTLPTEDLIQPNQDWFKPIQNTESNSCMALNQQVTKSCEDPVNSNQPYMKLSGNEREKSTVSDEVEMKLKEHHIKLNEDLREDCTKSNEDQSLSKDIAIKPTVFYEKAIRMSFNHDLQTLPTDEVNVQSDPVSCSHNSAKSLVDIRMVDFAHSTYKGFDLGDEDHQGVDTGYIHGLSTVIAIFEELQKAHGSISNML